MFYSLPHKPQWRYVSFKLYIHTLVKNACFVLRAIMVCYIISESLYNDCACIVVIPQNVYPSESITMSLWLQSNIELSIPGPIEIRGFWASSFVIDGGHTFLRVVDIIQ